MWSNMKNTIQKVAESVLGVEQPKRSKGWWDDECQLILEEKNRARSRMLQRNSRANAAEYKDKRKEASKMFRKKKRKEMDARLEEMESMRLKNDIRKFYKEINNVKKGFQPRINSCMDRDGIILNNLNDILKRWAEYFSEVLNKEAPGRTESNDCVDVNEEDVPPPSYEEILYQIMKLKNGKAPGIDNIDAEIIKNGGENLARYIHRLIKSIWENEKMPADWHIGVIVPLHKKGNKLKCSNYRGITLLSTVYKILSGAIATKLLPYANKIIGDYQAGFMQDRSTLDQIFTLRQILEKCHEFNISTFHLFIDYKQAYDSINRSYLWSAMKQLGVPMKLVGLAKMTTEGSCNRVKIQGNLSDVFHTRSGVRQGDCLAPILFNFAVEKVMRDAELTHNGTIWNKSSQQLVYADDKDLIGRSLLAVKEQFIKLEKGAKKCGLEINEEKTKFMCAGSESASRFGQNITIDEYNFEGVRNFKYLGSTVSPNNDCTMEIGERVKAGNRCFFSVKELLKSNLVTRASKIRIYKTIVRPVVTYACESWTLKKADETKLAVFERKVLRTIFGAHHNEDGSVRPRSNEECMQLYKDCDIVHWIKVQRLRWIGHVVRSKEDRAMSKIFNGKPEGKRTVGRPKTRWLDNVLKDISKLGIQNWKTCAKDRSAWKRTLEEAKAHNGL